MGGSAFFSVCLAQACCCFEGISVVGLGSLKPWLDLVDAHVRQSGAQQEDDEQEGLDIRQMYTGKCA